MKKQLLALVALTGLYTTSHAQAVLSAADLNPVVGDRFISHTCDTAGVTAMTGGASITWDYSTILNATTHDTVLSVAAAGCPMISMFPGTTVASRALSADTTINYFIHSSTAFAQNGYYHSVGQNVKFSNPLDQLHYPMTYLDSFNDTYTGDITVTFLGSPFTGAQRGTSHNVVDGWGTLKLPGGIVHTGVLREHMTQNFIDSSYIVSTLVAGFTLNTYMWYKAGSHSALLTISYMDQTSGFPLGTGGSMLRERTVAFSTAYPLSINDISGIENSIEVFPNPASDELNITFENLGNDNARVTLVDVMGREIAEISNKSTTGSQKVACNTSSLPRGLYLVRVQTGTEVVTRKVTLQ